MRRAFSKGDFRNLPIEVYTFKVTSFIFHDHGSRSSWEAQIPTQKCVSLKPYPGILRRLHFLLIKSWGFFWRMVLLSLVSPFTASPHSALCASTHVDKTRQSLRVRPTLGYHVGCSIFNPAIYQSKHYCWTCSHVAKMRIDTTTCVLKGSTTWA